MALCKLFCLPYAGGSSLIFSEWKNQINPQVEIVPIELKGRGKRFNEPFYNNITDAATDMLPELDVCIKEEIPYFFFGQSLGGLIIYEMLTIISHQKYPLPAHVFFSAIFPPHINKIYTKLHELSDQAFIKKLQRWASLPNSISENIEMLNTWTPILKSDYRLLETYHFKPQTTQLPIDITILKGRDDHWLSKEEYNEWRRYSDREIAYYEINGGHLFIHDQKDEIISIINNTIEEYL